MAIDALAAAAIGGTADVGAAAGAAGAADLGAVGATDLGGALGAASSTDLAAAAATPSLTTGADIGVLDTGTAALDTGAAGADLAASDVAAGGSGVLADTGATAAAGDLAGTSGVLSGGDVFSGAATGDLGTSFTGQPFGDVFSSADTGVGAGGQVSDIGSFGGGTAPPPPAGGNWAQAFPGVGENTGGVGFGADQTGGPIVSDTGIVDTGLPTGSGGASLGNTINVPSDLTPASENVAGGLTGGSIQAGGVQDIATQFGDLSSATTPAASFDTAPVSFADANTIGQPLGTVGTMQQGQLGTMMSTPLSAGGVYSPTGEVLTPSEAFATGAPTAVAGAPAEALPAVTTVPTAPGAVPATSATTGAPAVAGAPATGSSVPGATAAGGGIDPLTGLRMGAAGASIISSGINIANALNQPAYTALQPQYYPGSPFNPGPNAPGFPANNQVGGGIAGGLAASRLANGLLNGATPQQLAASGLISPQRATRLQGTYSGITQQYAQQLGVSPQSLSPGVKQMIAARALADTGLGGR